MNIIRDEEMCGLMMIPLFNQWGINRCNVKGCVQKPTTILSGVIKYPFGLCENHYNEFKKAGKISCTLDFCALENIS
jgi:hypothetical protein